jgi:transposase-like protein
MRTKILYAYCPHCDYENTFHTSRKYRKGLKMLKWPSLAWRCENCGKKFDSEIQWLTVGFEGWCVRHEVA